MPMVALYINIHTMKRWSIITADELPNIRCGCSPFMFIQFHFIFQYVGCAERLYFKDQRLFTNLKGMVQVGSVVYPKWPHCFIRLLKFQSMSWSKSTMWKNSLINSAQVPFSFSDFSSWIWRHSFSLWKCHVPSMNHYWEMSDISVNLDLLFLKWTLVCATDMSIPVHFHADTALNNG